MPKARMAMNAQEARAYYREAMDAAGVGPGDIQRPQDLTRLPISTKELLRKNYPQRITRPTGQKTYEARTSGSTGKNFAVREDAATAGWYRAAFMLSLEWAGWQMGEPHLQTGMTITRSLDRKLKDFLLRCHYVSAYNLSDKALDDTLNILEKHGVQHLWGYPGSLYTLARRAQEKGWNQGLRSAVTWGYTLYPHYRKTIETAFNTRVTDTYGCAEGVQIAAQCEYHR
jgi:phenylacetate-CoA ligase